MSVSFIQYKGKKILFIDYTQTKTTQEMVNVLAEVRKVYEKTTENFVALIDMNGTFGSTEYMQAANKLAKDHIDKRTLKTAILGITGLKKILLNGYNSFITNKLVPFDNKTDALEYLIK